MPVYPSYTFPMKLVFDIIFSFINNKKRFIKEDAERAISGVSPPIRIIAEENVPDEGPALVTLNHYARPGFFIAWAALGIAAQLPEGHIWLMTSAWTNRIKGINQIRTKITSLVFTRLAHMYGFITTPPMPPCPEETTDRAMSIRRIMRLIREKPDSILCIAPEGRDFDLEKLGAPPRGMGKFIYQIQKQLKRTIPVGIWEKEGQLMIRFGKAYYIDQENNGKTDDRTISGTVMQKIADLLPDDSQSKVKKKF